MYVRRADRFSEPECRESLLELAWLDINEPGAYVDKRTGQLYRIPKEALIKGSSPMIRKEDPDEAKLVRISSNPFITTFEARRLACELNVQPNF
ncbi:MAG: hypothetical protein DMG13_26090 [Acidobacteria bacterium]|nr:MAG: hypothetical protein DMG13_26090 [Acidobacteriota bacterium]